MNNDPVFTAFERLIAPLPDDLKADLLLAYKNEDIPHDENDSVYRLMVLLNLYGQFYQDMARRIAAAAEKIGQAHVSHLIEVCATYTKQTDQNQELWEDLKYIYQSLTELRKVMDEKPKSLKSQLELEMRSLFSELKSEGQKMIGEFSSYTARFKNDCEEWRARAYFAFLIGGIFIGIGGTLLILGLINSHGS